MKTTKILMYDPSNAGGLAIYTKNICKALMGKSCDVYLLTARPYQFQQEVQRYFHINDSLLHAKARDIYTRIKVLWAIDRIYRHFTNALRRMRYARALQPDIVHLQVLTPIIDVFLLSRLRKQFKLVYTVHDVFAHVTNIAELPWALKRTYHSVDHIIVHTKTNKAQLHEQFNIDYNKITVIPHGASVPPEQLPERIQSRKTLGLPVNKIIILFFGTIRSNKGLDTLLKSLSQVILKNTEIILLIAGNPLFRESFDGYQQLINELNIGKYIVPHIEFISEDKAQYYFRASDIVVLPYKNFGSQSGVLLQAYYYQRPVIVTDVGGLGELVRDDDTGIVINPGFPEELANAILSMIDRKATFETYKVNMLRAIKEKYSWDIVAQKTTDLYAEMCAAGTQARRDRSAL